MSKPNDKDNINSRMHGNWGPDEETLARNILNQIIAKQNVEEVEKLVPQFKIRDVSITQHLSNVIDTNNLHMFNFFINEIYKRGEITYKDNHHNNVLHLAVRENSINIATYLLPNETLESESNHQGLTPLELVVI